MKISGFILQMALLFYLYTFVHSFKCYQCSSLVNSNCVKHVRVGYNKPCSSSNDTFSLIRDDRFHDKPRCRTINQILNFRENPQKITIRECAFFYDAENQCSEVSSKDIQISECTCDSDGCNHATRIHTPCWNNFYMMLILIMYIMFHL